MSAPCCRPPLQLLGDFPIMLQVSGTRESTDTTSTGFAAAVAPLAKGPAALHRQGPAPPHHLQRDGLPGRRRLQPRHEVLSAAQRRTAPGHHHVPRLQPGGRRGPLEADALQDELLAATEAGTRVFFLA